MFRKSILVMLTSAAAACLVSSTFAQPANPDDGQILNYVQTVNKGEISDARMALKRSKSADVKAYAKHMLDDHSKSEKTIAALAKKAKVRLSKSDATAALKKEAADGDKQLRATKGADFDKQYAAAQDKMHREVGDTIQNQFVPAAKSDEVKSALSETLSTVREHQQMAHELAGKL